jgi:hypothetical protein
MRGGRVAAICACCGQRSRAGKPDRDGEPDLFDLGRGWSETPFPHAFKHADGSVGSKFTCPSCNKKLKAGDSLTLRDYQPKVAV